MILHADAMHRPSPAALRRYQRDFQPYQAFLPQACDFAVVALATFPEHHTLLMQALRALACPGQQFVLVVHNPDVLLGVPPGERSCLRQPG